MSIDTRDEIALSKTAQRVLQSRYLIVRDDDGSIESPRGMFQRVARNVAQAELKYGADAGTVQRYELAFLDVMARREFLPNSPTLMNAGTAIQQLSACFVLPVPDAMDGIFDTVKHAALIHKSGGGTGFSFSRLRPGGDVVGSTAGTASGPVSFMTVFDAATETVKQGGRRRGANMAILRVDHPDIMAFITAKDETSRLNNFNISVAVTDAFMAALETDGSYTLVNPRTGRGAGEMRAGDVFNAIVDAAWRTGEPGVVFIDRVNAANPTPALGDIESTNPCGEQPLLPYESCNLGSIHLGNLVRGAPGAGSLDCGRLQEVARVAVRFLDNVIDMNRYPIPEIAERTRLTRKIGLGVMGFADLLLWMGIPYDHAEAVGVARDVMRTVHTSASEASRELAYERGAFPAFKGSVYDQRGEVPRRNATVTTIAPTGSISIIADASSGVEPVYALAFTRRVLDGEEFVEVHPMFERIARTQGWYREDIGAALVAGAHPADLDAIPERWRGVLRTAHDVSPGAHVRIQAAFQEFTDNAVSKTVNLPGEASRDDVARAYRTAFAAGCKGVTIYRDGSRAAQVLSATLRAKAAAGPDPGRSDGRDATASDTSVMTVLRPRPRPGVVTGETRRVSTGCGAMYVTLNRDNAGRPFELFAQIGKAGGCAASQTEAIGRLVSLALRSGVEPREVSQQLRGVRCPCPIQLRGEKVLSCADGIGQTMQRALETGVEDTRHSEQIAPGSAPGGSVALSTARADTLAGQCPTCASLLEHEGGCMVCRGCGYSRC